MHVLMIGATGRNAGLVLPALTGRGVTVRALVRDEAAAATARSRGAHETALGDLRDEDSLRRAMGGIEGVFHINPAFAPDEAELGVALVRAADSAHVRKVVFSSVYHPSLSLTNHAAKRPVEEALFTSDLRFVVLQPAMFMQNLDGQAAAASTGTLSFPYSTRSRMTYVDYRDVAEVAALAMTGTDLDDGTFELAAGGTVDTVGLAQLFTTAMGRPVRAERADPVQMLAAMRASPTRDGMQRMLAEYDQVGFHGGNPLVLRSILGREPRSLTSYIDELVRRARGEPGGSSDVS